MSWLTLWAIVFYASVASFALVSALVVIFGWREVRELFAALADKNRDEKRSERPPRRATLERPARNRQ